MSLRNAAVSAVLALGLLSTTAAEAEIGIGADLVNRYVWRGADFGDGASIQPYISYASGPVEVGTWASYSVAASGANEHDLYVTYSVMDALSVTLTDYYFPADMGFFEFSDDDGEHSLEISASYNTGDVSILAGFFFLNDDEEEDALYVEVGYDLGEVSDGVTAGLFGAVGSGQYHDTSDSAIKFVNAGLSVANDEYSASYIINPEAETTFLVFGKSF